MAPTTPRRVSLPAPRRAHSQRRAASLGARGRPRPAAPARGVPHTVDVKHLRHMACQHQDCCPALQEREQLSLGVWWRCAGSLLAAEREPGKHVWGPGMWSQSCWPAAEALERERNAGSRQQALRRSRPGCWRAQSPQPGGPRQAACPHSWSCWAQSAADSHVRGSAEPSGCSRS